jgi:phenylacetic acid degradation operon negative regulatory protein
VSGQHPSVHAQSVLLTFCGAYVLDQRAVSAASFVRVLGDIGIREYATRSALTRMVRNGLLRTRRSGRQVYYGVSDTGRVVLTEAATRVWDKGVVLRRWNGEWTLFGFSIPESRRDERHSLRSRLTWAGFGMLQHGLWISPHPIDPHLLLAESDAAHFVHGFVARPTIGTDVDTIIASAWDLESLAKRYRTFLARWDVPQPIPGATALSRQLLLATEWLLLVREDPCLPLQHLPEDWPGHRAQSVARALRAALAGPARVIAERTIERFEPDE